MDETLNISTLTLSAELLNLVAEIDEFKGAWSAIGRIAPERLSALRRVATIESIGSSTRIEGAQLSDREVEFLLRNLDISSFASRDEEEVVGYAEVMELVFQSWENLALTENHIKQLHRDLLKYSSKDSRHRGEYKKNPNHVEAFGADGKSKGIVFATATPFDTPRLMTELVSWTAACLKRRNLHPLLVIAVFIVVFLEIHPFQDGNGRLSRILTTLLLLKSGYYYVPYSSLESVVEQTKESYFRALRMTQGTLRSDSPNWNPWILYFLQSLQQQKRRLETKMNREEKLLSNLPELSITILDYVKQHGRVTVSEVAELTGVSRNTVKDHLKKLTGRQQLVRHGAGRGTWYSLS
ncbi:MAG: Fic family protein [Bdellovibrionales bacterium]|nr:Fic family protein [Bdellovibrionales bacterium]